MVDKLDPRFADTVFVVEANSFERLTLWSMHSHQGSIESMHVPYKRYKWEQDSLGCMIEVGHINNEPVRIDFFWNIIDGHRVAFYGRRTWLIDLYMVKAWLEAHCNPIWDGSRRAHCNAMNFHHCLNAIDDSNGVRQ
ncbi:hypothetical protein LCGC14_2107590 [marine sediment metagenome]|uniref:Uncharacterized protein n=1 Tax=marine sediment metagenome TaxID=412755 RepID=A0A0F9EV95_9ZZZZ